MKKLILGLLVLFTVNIIAINAQGTKVGVIEADLVVQKSARGKAFRAQMENFQNAKKKEIQAMESAYTAKQKDAQAKAASMSDDKKREVGLDLQRMQTSIKRRREDAERQIREKLNAGLEKFQKELVPIIRQVALEKGLDLVFNYSAQSNIVFFGEKTNITADVITKYDARK